MDPGSTLPVTVRLRDNSCSSLSCVAKKGTEAKGSNNNNSICHHVEKVKEALQLGLIPGREYEHKAAEEGEEDMLCIKEEPIE